MVAPNGDGRVVVFKVDGGPMGFEQFTNLIAIQHNYPTPDKPVKIGESWKSEIDNPVAKEKKLHFTSTLVGKEKLLGLDVLKVKVELSFGMSKDTAEKDEIKSTETYYVDVTGSRIIRTLIKIPELKIDANGMEMKMDMEIRVSG